MTEVTRSQLDRIQTRSLMLGAAALLLCLVGAFLSAEAFFRAYLTAYLFWMGIGLGCLPLLMLHHLVGGQWGFIIRRFLESGTRTLPVLAVLFIPILFGLHHLYEWTHAEQLEVDRILQAKSLYLNVPFFIGRAVFYFAVWMILSYFLNRWAVAEDTLGYAALTRRYQQLSGPGIVAYGLTISFAAVDWAMSLEPHWFSTIYGLLFIVGQVLACLAFVIPVLVFFSGSKPISDVVSPGHLHDLGNLLFTFVMLWAYMSFSQFLIIWSGNLPEETTWYLKRTQNGWQWIAILLLVFHFAVPFFLLLSRARKRRPAIIGVIALGVVVMRFLDLFWLISPAFHAGGIQVHWLDVVMPVGIGGIWIAAFLRQLKSRPLLPAS